MKRNIIISILTFLSFGLLIAQDDMVFVEGGIYHFQRNGYGLKADTIINIPKFYIDKTEVTIKDFKRFIDATGYITDAEKDGWSIVLGGKKVEGVNWRCDERGNLRSPSDYDKYPVVFITWNDAMAYAKWAEKKLPTEAEWEYAFREGGKSDFKYSGSNSLNEVAWSSADPNVQSIKPVGLKSPNALGIYDMSGNVAEYTRNSYDRTGERRPLNVKVAKGGSFVDNRRMLQYDARMPAGYHSFIVGFRCVMYIENK